MAVQLKPVPKQISDAARATDEAHGQIYPTTVEPAPELPVAPPAAEAPPAAPPAAPPTPPPAAPVAAPPPGPAAGEDSVEYWRNRFQSLQGKYDKEVPALHSEVGAMRGKQQGLERLLAGMNTPAGAPLPPTDDTAEGEEALRKLEQEMGPEFVQGMTAVAARALRPHMVAFQERIEAFNNTIKGTAVKAAHDARESLYDTLDTQVPGWVQVNDTPEFANWLAVVDVFARDTRKNLLQRAFNANDTESVLAFFRAYAAHQQTAGPPPAQPGQGIPGQPAPPAALPAPARPTLETYVAPGRPGAPTGPTVGADGKRFWSRPEINKFYRDKLSGVYRGKEAEALKLEEDIILAGVEGRVT